MRDVPKDRGLYPTNLLSGSLQEILGEPHLDGKLDRLQAKYPVFFQRMDFGNNNLGFQLVNRSTYLAVAVLIPQRVRSVFSIYK